MNTKIYEKNGAIQIDLVAENITEKEMLTKIRDRGVAVAYSGYGEGHTFSLSIISETPVLTKPVSK